MREKGNGETGKSVQGNPGLPVGLIIVLGMAGFVSAADNWVVSALLPAVAADFGTGIATAAGMLTAYLVPYGVMQPRCTGIWRTGSARHRFSDVFWQG